MDHWKGFQDPQELMEHTLITTVLNHTNVSYNRIFFFFGLTILASSRTFTGKWNKTDNLQTKPIYKM